MRESLLLRKKLMRVRDNNNGRYSLLSSKENDKQFDALPRSESLDRRWLPLRTLINNYNFYIRFPSSGQL